MRWCVLTSGLVQVGPEEQRELEGLYLYAWGGQYIVGCSQMLTPEQLESLVQHYLQHFGSGRTDGR